MWFLSTLLSPTITHPCEPTCKTKSSLMPYHTSPPAASCGDRDQKKTDCAVQGRNEMGQGTGTGHGQKCIENRDD